MGLDKKITDIVLDYAKKSLPYIVSACISFSSLNIKSSEHEAGSGFPRDFELNSRIEYVEGMYYPMNLMLHDLSNDYKNNLDAIILLLSKAQSGMFKYNKLFDKIRINDDLDEIQRNNITDSEVFVVNKTFQKAGIYVKEQSGYTLSKSMDCSTALRYGRKKRNGDGKTSEGDFRIYEITPSHNKLFQNGLWYGPYTIRFDHEHPSILIHGNGTDTTKIRDWANNPHYIRSEPLGIYDNNFGYGRSHGCIRLENAKIREAIEDGTFQKNMRVMVHENKQMTQILRRHYCTN